MQGGPPPADLITRHGLWHAWSDCGGDLEACFTKEQLLTTVMLSWATGTIGSSFRIYRH